MNKNNLWNECYIRKGERKRKKKDSEENSGINNVFFIFLLRKYNLIF